MEDDGGITADINDLMTGYIQPPASLMTICNGLNGGATNESTPSCVEPYDIFAKHRRPESRPAPGDADEAQDFMEVKSVYPAYLSQHGTGEPIKNYAEYVNDNMSWDL